ncbi:MAG TPA: plastocyanin/azurin family copper-binding protein [Flavipsychrobacter sp.]|nr:plastocyanin/azurin family copper-binding protein [Flavipsychrobacter sp.]
MFRKLQGIFLLGFSSFAILPQSFATIHNVTVSNNVFTPSTITNAVVGDTIKWTWAASGHDVATTSTPSGATAISTGIQNSGFTFEYKIAVAGTYAYKCTPHASMGMVGGFTAAPLTSVEEVAKKPFTVAVNTTGNSFTLSGNVRSLTMDLLDLNGRKINSYQLSNTQNTTFDISALSQGIYILSIYADGKHYSEKLSVIR